MQEFIDGATAVAAVPAAIGTGSNARRIDRLAGQADGLDRTVQTVLLTIVADLATSTGG